jgi:hypothetical protein
MQSYCLSHSPPPHFMVIGISAQPVICHSPNHHFTATNISADSAACHIPPYPFHFTHYPIFTSLYQHSSRTAACHIPPFLFILHITPSSIHCTNIPAEPLPVTFLHPHSFYTLPHLHLIVPTFQQNHCLSHPTDHQPT